MVGNFTSAGGIVVGNMARWDGSQWHSVINSGTAAQINEIEAFNGKLYISGSFQYVDGVGANRAAVWDGILAPGHGFDLRPLTFQTSDRIYFSGSFNNFDTLTAYKLAWIDTQGNYGGLSILAAAHFNYINSINVRNDTLYLSTDQNLYWWNGTQFFNLIVNPRRVERSFYFNDTTYIIYSDYQNYKTYVSKLHTGNVLPPTLTSTLKILHKIIF
ncbi:MAG: hypothetical protein IPN36_05895 [Bacteroidetes bacterium]|nr:hypothetical protein [Bacteroidota bacterium]